MILRSFAINCPYAIGQELTHLDPLNIARTLFRLSKCPEYTLPSIFHDQWFIQLKQFIKTQNAQFSGNHLSACVYYMGCMRYFPSDVWFIYEMRFARTNIWEDMSFVSIMKTLEGFGYLPHNSSISIQEVYEKAELEIIKRLRAFLENSEADLATLEDVAMCIELFSRMECGTEELFKLLFQWSVHLCYMAEEPDPSCIIGIVWGLKRTNHKTYKVDNLMKFVKTDKVLTEKDMAYLAWIKSN